MALDLTSCDREPIHIPGAIQPHGALVALSPSDLTVTDLSENADRFLGFEARALLGRGVRALLPEEDGPELEALLRSDRITDYNPLSFTRGEGRERGRLHGVGHHHAGALILELEVESERTGPRPDPYRQSRSAMARLRSAKDLEELCGEAVKEVRRITGFDRVVIYRFDGEWNGSVLAEDRDDKAEPYLGLHFPASDIPAQARALYSANWLRLIPDVDYKPARILSLRGPTQPLDLSQSFLRSVSPIHLEYLRNMGCTASMSISLMREGRLWGLISCTHLSGPRHLSYEERSACELVGEFMSTLLPNRENVVHYAQRIRAKVVHGRLLERMTSSPDFATGLIDPPDDLLELCGASGAAIHFNGQTRVVGIAPEDRHLQALIHWLAERPNQELYSTDCLTRDYPPAKHFQDAAAGLIAASMSRGRNNYVLWFRPEVIQTVSWGGDPHKPAVAAGDMSASRLSPRKSFALWKETVRERSLPWEEFEVEAASELRNAIIDVVLERSEALIRLNTELERSNFELDSFAYAASHDLKEPLRGIHNYISLVLRGAREGELSHESRSRMETVVRLTQRMESLINSLLHYSQVGRTELSLRETDMNALVDQTIELLKPRLDEAQVEVRRSSPLPPAHCDRVRMIEVFTNLITNAIKYSDEAKKRVEIGCVAADGGQAAYFVRDNGIGIDPEFHDTVFRIFKRLHTRDKYGGGTGTGLTIIKRIIERHNGRIWIESKPGEGSTFLFTLADGLSRVSEAKP